MKKLGVAAVLLALPLLACEPSKEERWAAFQSRCTVAKFSVSQCEMLFQIVEKAADDADAASFLAATGVALGGAAFGAARP